MPKKGWMKAMYPVGKVMMKLGNAPIKSRRGWKYAYPQWKRMVDVVVVDDLIYGEPQPVSKMTKM